MLGGKCLLNFLPLDELLLEGQTLSVIAPGTGWGGGHGAQAKAIVLKRMAQQKSQDPHFKEFHSLTGTGMIHPEVLERWTKKFRGELGTSER